MLVSFRQATTGRTFQAYTQPVSGGVDGLVFFSENENANINTSEESLNTWQMLTMVKDGLNLYLYRNGVQVDTNTLTSATSEGTGVSQPFAFATPSWTFPNDNLRHRGYLWCFGAWSRALDTTEIASIYNSGNGKKYADL